jgi:hypothetical protein
MRSEQFLLAFTKRKGDNLRNEGSNQVEERYMFYYVKYISEAASLYILSVARLVSARHVGQPQKYKA